MLSISLILLQYLSNQVFSQETCVNVLVARKLGYALKHLKQETKTSESACKVLCLTNQQCGGILHYTNLQLCVLLKTEHLTYEDPVPSATAYVKECQSNSTGVNELTDGTTAVLKETRAPPTTTGTELLEEAEAQPLQDVTSKSYWGDNWLFGFGGVAAVMGVVLLLVAFSIFVSTKKKPSNTETNQPKKVSFEIELPSFMLPKKHRERRKKKREEKSSVVSSALSPTLVGSDTNIDENSSIVESDTTLDSFEFSTTEIDENSSVVSGESSFTDTPNRYDRVKPHTDLAFGTLGSVG